MMKQHWLEYKVTDEIWEEYQEEIFNLMSLDERTVQEIWHKKGEKLLRTSDDFENMTYFYDIPLYQKMIWRLRNAPEEGRAFFFWNQIDPICRRRLCFHYGMFEEKKCNAILNLLIWYYNTHFITKDSQFLNTFKDPVERTSILEEYNQHLDNITLE